LSAYIRRNEASPTNDFLSYENQCSWANVRRCLRDPTFSRFGHLAQYWRVTDRRTDGHTMTASTVVASSSAVASRQTAKFRNSNVTITMSLLWMICQLVARIDIAYLCTKFDDFRFSLFDDLLFSDMTGAPKFFNGSHDLTTPLSGCLSSVGCDLHIQTAHQI